MSSHAHDGSRLHADPGTGGDPGARGAVARAVYRLALLAYPARHRRRTGREMAELFDDLHTEALGSGGRAGAWLLTIRAVGEALWRGTVARIGRTLSPVVRSAARPGPGGGRRRGASGGTGHDPDAGPRHDFGDGPGHDPGGAWSPARRRALLGGLVQDARYALRTFASAPAVALVAVAVFALGIGANTAMFSVVEAALLRSLPFDEPDRLVDVNELPRRFVERGDRQGGGGLAALPVYRVWRERAASFEEMAVYTSESPTLTGLGEAERIRAYPVSSNLLSLLGVRPRLGRGFTPEEDRPGAPRIVVLSHAFWSSRLGGDPGAVGRTIRLDGEPHEIVGVMPPGFRFPVFPPRYRGSTTQAWLPLGGALEDLERSAGGQGGAWIVGRLREGVTPARAQEELDGILGTLEREGYREGWVANVTPLHAYLTGDVGQPLLITLGAVALVLLVACANVANLLLARATSRHREMSVRMALGASWQRLMGQMLVESVLLAGGGGILGVLLAHRAIPLIVAWSQDLLPRVHEVGINASVLATTLAATFLAGILAGCAPAIRAARRARAGNLTPTPTGASRDQSLGRTTGLLVVAQVSLTLMLVAGAGLLVRSLSELLEVDTGFQSEGVMVVEATLPGWAYPETEQRAGWARRALDAARAIPGVTATAVTSSAPFESGIVSSVSRPDGPEEPSRLWAVVVATTPGYFELSDIPLRRGVLFDDAPATGPVAVIDEAAAEAYFPGEDPLGKRLTTYRWSDDPLTIVGVVGNSRADSLREEPPPHVYVDLSESPERWLTVLARSPADPAAVLPQLREAVREVDPLVPVGRATTLDALVADSLRRERFYTILLGSFAAAAILMAGVGIFGVMRYAVSRRTREMGIRIALGARDRDIFATVVGRGLLLTVLGIGLGLLGAAATTRLLSSFLYELSPWDPITFGGAAAFLAAMAVAASLLPAWRATRVDPVRSLRAD